MIKYSEAKSILAKYAGIGGKCATDEGVDLFVKQVLQYLLYQGTNGNERKFCFYAVKGCVTLPKELEVPLKVRIDGEVKSVWNRWFEYRSGNSVDEPCLDSKSILEDPNRYPTAYDLPTCGGYPAVIGVCQEAEDAHVIVKGTDLTGREIYSTHKGEKITGVYLTIRKSKITTTDIKFGKITEVYKTPTKGYVTLLGMGESDYDRTFLADYSPYEETPSYRRIRFLTSCPDICKVSILGRIKLKDHYADEDLIPFDNLYLLQVAGQTVNKMYNDDMEKALAKDSYVKGLIETEGNYKKVNNGQPMEIFQPLSGGAAVSPVRAGRKFFRRW